MPNHPVIERIAQFNRDRTLPLVTRKYHAMRQSPFAFLRGTCHLFYEDWPVETPLNDAPLSWISGDLHLENFGCYKGDNRLMYFDLNDFDEAVLAPATWELTRFITSIWVGASVFGIEHVDAAQLGAAVLDTYSRALTTGKTHWLEREDARGMIRHLFMQLAHRSRRELLDSRTVLPRSLKQAKRETGRRIRHFQIDGQHLLPVSDDERMMVLHIMAEVAAASSDAEFFTVLDVARRVAGTGSLGVNRYVVLVEGKGSPDRNALLDLKQALPSSLAPYVTVPQPTWISEAARVVSVQRRVQAVSPALLTAVQAGDTSYVLRELQPIEDRIHFEPWHGKLQRLENTLCIMAQAVAWGHLRAGGRDGSAIADAWLAFGQRSDWQRSVLEYAQQYGRQVIEDWKTFSTAYDAGALTPAPASSPQ